MPIPPRIKETCLYVADLTRAVKFYTDLFGYEVMASDDRFAALSVGGQDVLLLFLEGATVEPAILPNGGVIPPHDGSGTTHLGLGIPKGELAAWEARLTERGVAVESRVNWERGGTSIYFRDPDGHLLELLTPGVWPIY
jgi:catechol 2,3-dioxygenase-like lactoylglutathione lyase family enzyme